MNAEMTRLVVTPIRMASGASRFVRMKRTMEAAFQEGRAIVLVSVYEVGAVQRRESD